MGNLAVALFNQNKLSESEALQRELVATSSRTKAGVDPTLQGNLAEVLRRQGKLGEAESLLRTALAVRRRSGPRSLDEAGILAGLGRTLGDRKAYAEAAEVLTLAIEIRRERLGDKHPTVIRTQGLSGRAGGTQTGDQCPATNDQVNERPPSPATSDQLQRPASDQRPDSRQEQRSDANAGCKSVDLLTVAVLPNDDRPAMTCSRPRPHRARAPVGWRAGSS